MARLGIFEDDDYSPEFGILMVRDLRGDGVDGGLLADNGTDAQPCGTLTRAGYGWLEGSAGDGPHLVRIQSHLTAPDDDFADWDDVVETPYYSASGSVYLTIVTGSPADSPVPLGESGLYRVRVLRKRCADPAEELEDIWQLRFWPVAEPPEPPRWFARRDPAGSGTSAASDVMSVVLWGGERTHTVAALADRLLMSEEDVRGAVDYAVRHNLVTVDGNLSARFTVIVRPAKPYVRSTVSAPVPQPGPPWDHPVRLPLGAPARGGFVRGTEVVVWRDGEPVVLGAVPPTTVERAMESNHGVVVMGADTTWLVRLDGTVQTLGTDFAARAVLSADGRFLAAVERRYRRLSAWQDLHLVDLADGSTRSIALDPDVEVYPVGAHEGGASFRGGEQSWEWRPGAEPEPLATPASQWRYATPSPGGAYLYQAGGHPPSIDVLTVADGTRRRHSFPLGSKVHGQRPRPVWEDAHHLVVVVDFPGYADVGTPAIRLDLRTGEFDGVAFPVDAGYQPLPVEPLIS